jgi:hypothetical protein
MENKLTCTLDNPRRQQSQRRSFEVCPATEGAGSFQGQH